MAYQGLCKDMLNWFSKSLFFADGVIKLRHSFVTLPSIFGGPRFRDLILPIVKVSFRRDKKWEWKSEKWFSEYKCIIDSLSHICVFLLLSDIEYQFVSMDNFAQMWILRA